MTSWSLGLTSLSLYEGVCVPAGERRGRAPRAQSILVKIGPFLSIPSCPHALALDDFIPVCHLFWNLPLRVDRTCLQSSTLCPTHCHTEGILKTFLGHFMLFLLGASPVRRGPIASLSLSSYHQFSTDLQLPVVNYTSPCPQSS